MDITILGAGVIGLSLALELHRRGAQVALYEPQSAAAQASWAAAGMLAVEDPFNPPALLPLSRLSASLYPVFLRQLGEEAGIDVPFQTTVANQHMADGSIRRLQEASLDPRQLAVALLAAAQASRLPLHQRQGPASLAEATRRTGTIIHATGAWADTPAVTPRKGQMLRVQLPPDVQLREVHRSEHVYVVPRTEGPQAGTALIGATVENAGFNTDIDLDALADLRQRGAGIVPHVPALAEAKRTPLVEAWAGLRPATPDGMPLLGAMPHGPQQPGPRHIIAAGHFRNGILLAPATAVLIADLVEGRPPALDLDPFAPLRFTHSEVGRA